MEVGRTNGLICEIQRRAGATPQGLMVQTAGWRSCESRNGLKVPSLPPARHSPWVSLCCAWLVLEMASLLCRTGKDYLVPGAYFLLPLSLPPEAASALGCLL